MYKSKLQELCHKKSWQLPVYTTVNYGPRHLSRFTVAVTVTVENQVFETPEKCTSTKGAENSAARIAFEHLNAFPLAGSALPAVYSQFQTDLLSVATLVAPLPEMLPIFDLFPVSPLPSSLPIPTPGLLPKRKVANPKPDVGENHANTQASAGSHNEGNEGYAVARSSIVSSIEEYSVDNPSQNIQPTSTIRKYHDPTNEGLDPPAKRARASSETLENQPLQRWKTLVTHRDVNCPIPEKAIVEPYSNEKWVAYKLRLDKETTAYR